MFLGDFHVGNRYGICSPNPINENIGQFEPSELQKKLYEGYQKCLKRLKYPNKIKALISLGDMVDGPNVKKPGKDLWTLDPIYALYDLAKIIKPLAMKAEIIRCIMGSYYHVSPGSSVINYDEMFAQMVGATPFHNSLLPEGKVRVVPKSENGKKVKALLSGKHALADDIKNNPIFNREFNNGAIPEPKAGVRFKGLYNGVAIIAKHQGSYSPNYMYRGTGLIRNNVILALQKKKLFPNGYEKLLVGYGHSHYYHLSGNASDLNFNCPCFKANDEFLQMNGVSEPDFGIVEVIIDPDSEIQIRPLLLSGDDYPVESPIEMS